MSRELLISHLHALDLLDNRYAQIKCINYDLQRALKGQGYFSLVFKAHDTILDKPVVLKFFDPTRTMETYRIDCFRREPDVLKVLRDKPRCLQLAEDLKVLAIPTATTTGHTINLQFEYFALDWIDEEIESHFNDQCNLDAEFKLRLFNDIVLGVQAIHRSDIFHRDLKPDNFRAHKEEIKRIVVAIDLGTAASYASKAILPSYGGSVGLPLYASHEARCGLAGVRQIAARTDYYALGCMLYELFNLDLFGAVQQRNNGFMAACAAMAMLLATKRDEAAKVETWESNVGRFRALVSVPTIAGPDHTAPLAIVSELDKLLLELVEFDYKNRISDLDWVRQRVWNMISVLKHQRLQNKRIEIKRSIRAARAAKALQREERLKVRSVQMRLVC